MKRIPQTLLLILLYLVCCSKSCDSDTERRLESEQAQILASQDSVMALFTGKNLDETEMMAFGESGKMKLADLLDYIKMLEKESQSPVFQQQARKMILGLFDNDSVEIRIQTGKSNERKRTTLASFLLHQDEMLQHLSLLKADSAWILHPLQADTDTVFRGALGFSLSAAERTNNEPPAEPVTGSVEIILKQKEKEFGPKKVRVWNVYLGPVVLARFK